jgi:dTDP-glucose pyrophosphorylase
MAGAGSRFAISGYAEPKPLIPIDGIPMIRVVIQNLTPHCPHCFIFICQNAHIQTYGLKDKLSLWAPGCVIHGLDGVTEGAACTVLFARADIDTEVPLMIANSDQYLDVDINEYLKSMSAAKLDGLIMTMHAHDPKWSFVGLNDAGLVTNVVEKEVISNEATVGIYNFSKGRDFVRAADEMIARNLRVNNEFYVAPVYNRLIEEGKLIGTYNIGAEGDGMYGLGIPSDLELFLRLPIHEKATKGL